MLTPSHIYKYNVESVLLMGLRLKTRSPKQLFPACYLYCMMDDVSIDLLTVCVVAYLKQGVARQSQVYICSLSYM